MKHAFSLFTLKSIVLAVLALMLWMLGALVTGMI